MKKIFAIVFMIMMFCQVCFAFNQPDPNRWHSIVNNDAVELFIDAKTVRFYKKYGEDYVNFWIMDHQKKDGTYSINEMEMNLDKRQWRLTSINGYKADGSIDVSTTTPSPIEAIVPGSLFESVYDMMVEIHKELDKRANNPTPVISKLNK